MTDSRRSPTVFIHASWRTSSTFVWQRLRANSALRCYSEPLHEGVASLTPAIARAAPRSDAMKLLHHPPMALGYFAEYEPLLGPAGTGFRKDFSYDRFFLSPAEPHEELQRYLESLIRAAHEHRQRPVLAFVRSTLRAAWMQRRFGGLHIAQLRDPRQQWASMIEQHRQGGTYFLAGCIAIAAKLHTRFPKAFAHLKHDLVDYRGANYNPAELGRYLAAARELDDTQFYGLFMLIWLASALQTLSVSTLALDCDRLSADHRLRKAIEDQLSAEGLPVDLSGFRTPVHADLPLSTRDLEAIETDAITAVAQHARILVLANPQRIAKRLNELTPRSAELVRRVLAQLHDRGFFGGSAPSR